MSASDDNFVKVWDANTGANACCTLNGHSDLCAWQLLFFRIDTKVVSGSC